MILGTLRFFTRPVVLLVISVLALVYLIGNREDLTSSNKYLKQAQENLEELARIDPEAGKIVAQIKDNKQRRAMEVAALSASEDTRRRSVLADMAEEMEAVEGMPYRARLAKLSLDDGLDWGKEEDRQEFLDAHGMTCQTLTIASGWGASSHYCTLLEQASRMPNVWPLVKDDPMALLIWEGTDDLELVRFYRENREWLADSLAALDLSGDDGLTVENVLRRVRRRESIVKEVVSESGSDLGVIGLSVMLTHGALVSRCQSSYGLHPGEVIPIIWMNGDIFGENEGNKRSINKKAAWLAQIQTNHSTVWYAAGASPLALRLHRDAPQVANDLLLEYGHEEIASLIYQYFTEPEEVSAAAHAVEMFGDLTLFVFAKYDDEEFMSQLGKHLTDGDIGARAIPFILRFEDDAWRRMQDDPRWVDRYFKDDGSPREDDSWIKSLPGGAAYKVAKNYVQGYPSEWSELGWAAVDVADGALLVASLGSSKAVTTTAKVAANGARTTARTSKAGSRARSLKIWKKKIQIASRPTRTGARRFPRLTSAARKIGNGTLKVTKPIWGTIRVAKIASKGTYRGAQKSLRAWKSVSPARRKLVYRGLLATGLFFTITERTIPNMDKIGEGVGEAIGDAAAGGAKLAGNAVAAAVREVLEEMMPEMSRVVGYWFVVGVVVVLVLLLAMRVFMGRRRVAVQRS